MVEKVAKVVVEKKLAEKKPTGSSKPTAPVVAVEAIVGVKYAARYFPTTTSAISSMLRSPAYLSSHPPSLIHPLSPFPHPLPTLPHPLPSGTARQARSTTRSSGRGGTSLGSPSPT